MEDEIKKPFLAYIEAPSAEKLELLRKAIVASPEYAPYSERSKEIHQLLEAKKFEEAKTALLASFPNYLLSPGIHQMLAFVHHKLGDESSTQAELQLHQICLEAILSTGTGDEDHPYSVLHTEDEYDVIHHLGKKSQKQKLFRMLAGERDVHECEDGSEIWFDISAPYSVLAARFKAGNN
jgi:hypothetical protein